MSAFDLKAWMQPHLDRVEQALSAGIAADSPARLGEAMRYAVLDGGKRLRPLLVLATAEGVAAGNASVAGAGAVRLPELLRQLARKAPAHADVAEIIDDLAKNID